MKKKKEEEERRRRRRGGGGGGGGGEGKSEKEKNKEEKEKKREEEEGRRRMRITRNNLETGLTETYACQSVRPLNASKSQWSPSSVFHEDCPRDYEKQCANKQRQFPDYSERSHDLLDIKQLCMLLAEHIFVCHVRFAEQKRTFSYSALTSQC
jgi:hypothetical protein